MEISKKKQAEILKFIQSVQGNNMKFFPTIEIYSFQLVLTFWYSEVKNLRSKCVKISFRSKCDVKNYKRKINTFVAEINKKLKSDDDITLANL